MTQLIVAFIIMTMAILTPVIQGVAPWDSGAGTAYTLAVVQDVWIARNHGNRNYADPWLHVAKHTDFPNARSLVQFENLPSSCPTASIKFAKMYLYFHYAHRASWHAVQRTPYIPRHLEVHLVKKFWREDQATDTIRHTGAYWSTPYLGLDGTDAEASTQSDAVTVFTDRPQGFVEFDITDAVKSWRNGVPNYGLLIRATNELDAGRDVRFFSMYHNDASMHPFVKVLCA